jgi:hypothetical protein
VFSGLKCEGDNQALVPVTADLTLISVCEGLAFALDKTLSTVHRQLQNYEDKYFRVSAAFSRLFRIKVTVD